VVGQDNVRRTVLRERDVPGGANIGLIDAVARYALDAGYHVVVEGILHADRYGEMLRGLREDHRGQSRFYYLDVPFRPRDLLAGGIERVIGAESSLDGTIGQAMGAFAPGPAAGVAFIGQTVVSQGPAKTAEIRRHYDRLRAEFTGPDGMLALPHAALLATGVRSA
jgi:hypothetical protein